MLISSVVYLVNYVLVIFWVHSPLASGDDSYSELVVASGQNSTGHLVDSGRVCAAEAYHSLMGEGASATHAHLQCEGPSAYCVLRACGATLSSAVTSSFVEGIGLAVRRISPAWWYGRTGLVTQSMLLVVADVIILAFNEVYMLVYTMCTRFWGRRQYAQATRPLPRPLRSRAARASLDMASLTFGLAFFGRRPSTRPTSRSSSNSRTGTRT